MIPLYVIALLSTPLGATVNEDIISLERLKFIHLGDKINLTCSFSSIDASAAAWFKETPGEKPLLIATAFRSTPVAFHNGFNKNGRYRAIRERSSFILNILDAEPSDSATYYCAVVDYSNLGLGACTVLVLKGRFSVLQPPVSDPVELGGDTTLQCSILTDTPAGDHSVYWFRRGSGESHPGIIYTHGNRSDECKKSSETDSPTQSCVYKLPKRNLSLSDAGTYYCAVLMCGEIIFGNGTKLDFAETNILNSTIVVLAASTVICLSVALYLCRKHKEPAEGHTVQAHQAACDEAFNLAAGSFNSEPQHIKEADVQSLVIYYQQN